MEDNIMHVHPKGLFTFDSVYEEEIRRQQTPYHLQIYLQTARIPMQCGFNVNTECIYSIAEISWFL